MAFKPNYGRDRAERARAARAHSEEKQRKKDEKTALRKSRRAESEHPPERGLVGRQAKLKQTRKVLWRALLRSSRTGMILSCHVVGA